MGLKITLVILVLAITYLSLTPSEIAVVGNDKISHFIAYAVLTFNIGLLVFPSKRRLLIGMLVAVLFGILIECIQHYIPGRFRSIEDVYANTIGVALGGLLTLAFGKGLLKLLRKFRLFR